MDYIPEKMLQIVISFTLLYRNVSSFRSHFLQEANFKEMISIPFHQERNLCEYKSEEEEEEEALKISAEGLKNFEAFQELLRASYKSIKAPFEKLDTADMHDLTQLVAFLNNKLKMDSMGYLTNFAEKGKW